MCSINTVQKKSSDILGSLNATLDQDQVDSTAIVSWWRILIIIIYFERRGTYFCLNALNHYAAFFRPCDQVFVDTNYVTCQLNTFSFSVSEVEPHHSLMQGNSKQLMEPPFIGRVTASIGRFHSFLTVHNLILFWFILSYDYRRKWQHLLDRSTIYVSARWTFAFILLATYAIRVLYLNAFHIVTYGLGIYLLNMFIGFLSPQVRRHWCVLYYCILKLLHALIRNR